jgi:dUTP pyrophosphatase
MPTTGAKVLLVNHGATPFLLRRGERIAQLLLAPVPAWGWQEVAAPADLGGTQRGEGGYGSTGKT